VRTWLTNEDYCIVAFGIILFISTFQWFIDGRKNFTGPKADMGIEVLEALKSHEHEPTTDPADLKGSELKDST
jgi:choline transport protein